MKIAGTRTNCITDDSWNLLWPLVLSIAVVFSGCGKKEEAGTGSGGGAAQKKLKLAFVSNNAANFWTIARRGTEEAEKQLGNVEVLFRIPSTGSAAEQVQILDDLLAAGVDGIAVSPVDPANETDELNKIASQTLLITHDSDAPNSKRVCYIGTDNFAAGVEAGKLIKEALPEGGKIMVFVGKADAQNAKDRFGGIKKELEGTKVEIIDERTDDTDTVRAQKNAEDTLVKYPDVACLVGLWSYNGPAILNAVRDGGKAGKVKIVCFDEDTETLNGVAQGTIYGTVVQQPFEFGKQAITRMAEYVRGDKTALAGGKQIIPTLSIKKDTVADFQARLKQLLGK
jgi:ribose transport system substrate-binding protein